MVFLSWECPDIRPGGVPEIGAEIDVDKWHTNDYYTNYRETKHVSMRAPRYEIESLPMASAVVAQRRPEDGEGFDYMRARM